MEEENHRTPKRRGVLTSLLTLISVAYAYMSLNKTWYYLNIEVPDITLPGIERIQTGYAQAQAQLTAYTLTLDGTAMTYKGPQKALEAIGGLPIIFLLLCLAALLVIISAFLQNSLFAIVSIIILLYTRNSVENMQSMIQNPLYGGAYMQAGEGIDQFGLSLISIIFSALLVGLYVLVNNHKRRKEQRENGENSSNIVETLYSVYSGSLAKAADKTNTSKTTT